MTTKQTLLMARSLTAAVLCALNSPTLAATKPAVLIASWHGRNGEVDFDYLRQLAARGINVDFLENRAHLTWDKLKLYNAVVLYDFPVAGEVVLSPDGVPARGAPNLETTLALLDRYLDAGGGVLINIQHISSPALYDATRTALGRWGARLPAEELVIPDAYTAEHPRLRIRFGYTDNIQPSPVSADVKGFWFPLKPVHVHPYNVAFGPVDVDDSWTTVARAGPGSRSRPIDTSRADPANLVPDPFVRPGGVAEPTLFAIRELGAGRLALFRGWPVFHLGSGTSWLHNGAMLNTGLHGRPSHFGALLENTLRWLAEPSLASGRLGGAVFDPARITPPQLRPGAKERVDEWLRHDLAQHRPPPDVKLFRGFIGARTRYSGGEGTVAEYAAAARAAGLHYLVFLEDIRQLSADELRQLVADCAAESRDGLKLFAGYRVRTNLGNQMFVMGPNPLYPPAHLLDEERTFRLQAVNEAGQFIAGNQSLTFVFNAIADDRATVGYFDFTGPQRTGGLGVADLRAFSMVAVRYYVNGQLIEDVTDQYLLTNQGTMPGTPVAVDLVDSPAALADAVAAGHGITYAGAASLETLWQQALRWNHQLDGMNVFPSTGPLIKHWPACFRTCAFGAEDFVTEKSLMPADLEVVAPAGLQEVTIYDGARLFRRFVLNGETNFAVRLFLYGVLQQNLSVVATDRQGGRAVSFPRRSWAGGSIATVFCSDHVNDCGGMKLARGPVWQKAMTIPNVPSPGFTWDGGPSGTLPLMPLGHIVPVLISDAGRQGDHPNQIPLLEFCDERVHRGRSVLTGAVLPGVPHVNPWSGFGPITPPKLFDATASYTEWAQFTVDVDPHSWGCPGLGGGNATTLFTHEMTFKKPQTVRALELMAAWRPALPGVNVLLLVGEGDRLVAARDITPHVSRGRASYVIPTGGWFGAVSPQEGNSTLHINRGRPLRLIIENERIALTVELPDSGQAVQAGEQWRIELLTVAWPMSINLSDSDAMLRMVRYLAAPDGLEINRGRRVASPGILELEAQDGAVEFAVPRGALSLPTRVNGLNPRWTTLLLQREGYNGKQRYGPGTNRTRPLGVDFDGRAYIHVYSTEAPRTHLMAGHPIVADPAGRDLFIQVTRLTEQPPRWHISVNNPTDQPITTVLRQTMDVPGLQFEPRTVTLRAGEYQVLQHETVE